MGPEYPTPAELGLPRAAGCEVVAHCNGALVFQAASAGLPVAVVSVVTRTSPATATPTTSAPPAATSPSLLTLSAVNAGVCATSTSTSTSVTSSHVLTDAQLDSLDGEGAQVQAGFDLVRPVSQGDAAQLQAAADLIRKAYAAAQGSGATASGASPWCAAVLIDEQLAAALVVAGAQPLLRYADLPGFDQVTQGGAVHHVPVCQGEGEGAVNVLAFCGFAFLSRGDHNASLSLVSRLTAVLGLSKLVLCQQAADVQDAAGQCATPRVTVLRDHVNLSGRNSLYGKNQAWGHRFFDAGKCYHEGMRTAALAALGHGAEEGVLAAQVVGPLFRSPALARLCRFFDADLVTTSLVQEALVAHHMSVSVLGLLVVRASVACAAEDSCCAVVSSLSAGQAAAVRKSLTAVLSAVLQ
jgi:purine-nucleoside phosphorylase